MLKAIGVSIMTIQVLWENEWIRGLVVGIAIGAALVGLAWLLPDDQPAKLIVP